MQRSAALLTTNGDERLPAEEAWGAPRAAIRNARATGGLAWFHLVDPDAEEMTAAGRALDLNPLTVEDAASGRQQPNVPASLVASRDHSGDFALEEQQRVEPFLRDLIDDVSGTATLAANQARELDAVVSSYETTCRPCSGSTPGW